MKTGRRWIGLLVLWCGLALADSAPVLGYRVVASYPHDANAFTQGLVFIDGRLYESTGHYGHSTLRRVDLATGRVEQEVRLAADLFGEGLMYWRGRLVQLTWRQQLGIVYDAKTFKRLDTFHYSGEGWGLTHDGHHWIMSDGTDELRFLDPETRQVERRLRVRDGERPVTRLNELEYIDGTLWANIWRQDRIALIVPETGQVVAYVDLGGLYPPAERPNAEAILNGIAYDATVGRLFITGKYWPHLYEILIDPDTKKPG
ncbi:MAG: glutaminyl-peptide cyclotransferase [Thermochromatium sp.]